jgi:ABC-type phosphate/phosphonate transport system, periplasmic component
MLKRPLALAAGLVLSCCAVVAQAADTLRVSAIPDEAPTELLRKFEPLGKYLSKQLGMEVKFVPVPTTRRWSSRWPATAWIGLAGWFHLRPGAPEGPDRHAAGAA